MHIKIVKYVKNFHKNYMFLLKLTRNKKVYIEAVHRSISTPKIIIIIIIYFFATINNQDNSSKKKCKNVFTWAHQRM